MSVSRRRLALLLPAVVLAACGVRGFSKEGATRSDFDNDLRQCVYESNIGANPCFPGSGGCQKTKARNACMERKGWQITRDGDRYMAGH